MVTFLAPGALLGALLLAIPITVHLFRPRKMRQTPFSSLRWLRQTRQRLSRRIQWHQLFLFLLRAGVITALVLALARPLFTGSDSAKPIDRYVIVDVGRGMAYQPSGRSAPIEQARDAALALVHQARPMDRTAVLLATASPRVLATPSHDTDGVLSDLSQLHSTSAEADLSATLPLVKAMLTHGRPDADTEICFVTANRRAEWSEAAISSFLKEQRSNLHVRVVDVGLTGAQNGWIASARLLPSGKGQVLRVDLGCVGDRVQERTVSVVGMGEPSARSHTVMLEPGWPTRVEFDIPADADLHGRTAEVRLDPPDALPDDDRYFVNLDTSSALRVLLVEPEGEAVGQGLHLGKAMEALGAAGTQSVELVRRGAGTLTAADAASADVIFLAGVPDLPEAAREAIEKRVQTGGGLVIFLGPAVHADYYNDRLFRPLRPTDGLMPVAIGATVEPPTPVALTAIRWSHPLLAPLYDPVAGDLPVTTFQAHSRFTSGPSETDTVLAQVGDTPAIVERTLGAGQVILFNTTANDAWGDLPRSRSFVPLVDRLLAYLSAGGVRRSFNAGQALMLPLPAGIAPESVMVQAPSDHRLKPEVTQAAGRPVLRFGELAEPGAYRVEAGSQAVPFVVNVGRADSPLTPMDQPTLVRWWAPIPCEVVVPASVVSLSGPATIAWPLTGALIAVAGLLFLLEMYFVHRFCPRPNPALVETIVGRGSLLRPLKG